MSSVFTKRMRQCLSVVSIIISGTAVAIPDETYSKVMMALGTAFNAASLYMLKEENQELPTGIQNN